MRDWNFLVQGIAAAVRNCDSRFEGWIPLLDDCIGSVKGWFHLVKGWFDLVKGWIELAQN
jgi:hypothetical protein